MSTMLNKINVFCPAIFPDVINRLKTNVRNWSTKNDGLVDTTAIMLRTTTVFLAVGSSCFRFLSTTPWGQNSLISRATFLEISPTLASEPILHSLASLATLPLKFSASLIIACVGWYVSHRFEIQRAESSIHTQVIEEFIKNKDKDTKSYLAENPSAVALLIKKYPENVKKNSVSLLRSVIANTLSSHNTQVFKLIINFLSNEKLKISKELFKSLLQKDNPTFVLYALSKKVVPDLTADEIVEAWNLVTTNEVAEIFIQQGFGIDTIDSNNLSPLLNVIKELCQPDATKSSKKFYLLLNHGARVPDLNTSLTIGATIKSIQEWFQDYPKLLKALEQAKKQPSEKQSQSKLKEFDSHLFAIWQPPIAISSRGLRVKKEDIVFRTALVASTAFALPFALLMTIQKKSSILVALGVSAISCALISRIYYVRAWKNATWELDQRAIEAFKGMRFPEPQITKYLSRYPTCIGKLVSDATVDLDKQDANGKTLFERIILENPEIHYSSFAGFVDLLFPKLSKDEKFAYLQAAIGTNSVYAFHLLRNQLVILTPEQQFECWISSPKSITVLGMAAAKFPNAYDINMKNKDGYTPLLYIASRPYLFNRSSQIKDLLELDADPTVTVSTVVEEAHCGEKKDNPRIDKETKIVEKGILDFLDKEKDKKIIKRVAKAIAEWKPKEESNV